MQAVDLSRIAQSVVKRAQCSGYVVPRDVREELAEAGISGQYARDVLTLARPALRYSHGRYYYVSPAVSRLRERVRQEKKQLEVIYRSVRELIQHHQAIARVEKREHRRVQFVHPIEVATRDGRTFYFISLDISPSGIRLLGSCNLARQKVRIRIPRETDGSIEFAASVLWARPIGDGLIQQGALFLEAGRPDASSNT